MNAKQMYNYCTVWLDFWLRQKNSSESLNAILTDTIYWLEYFNKEMKKR